jgi:hypothetical protein
MNANEHRRRVPRVAIAVLALAGSGAAHAHAEMTPPLGWPDTDTVDELLRRETRAALAAQARRRAIDDPQSPAGARTSAEPGPDRIDLAAIYGIGKRLHVEVLVNGQRLRYRHGHKWPEEAPDGVGVYVLKAIEGQCVMLDGATGGRKICLSRGN